MTNKYNARKYTVDGMTFDSKKEARRYMVLRDMEKNGEISDLRTQVKYVLIPQQRETGEIDLVKGKRKQGKVIERECVYVADFVYLKDGNIVVEDVKGYRKGIAYSYYAIKRKLMLYVHGIRITEV